jgi:general transcription factor 3C polypeptide 5 (transcription factor C subunit 1)
MSLSSWDILSTKLIRLQILNSVDPEECVPLYLRFDDPACAPILSHNSATNNVLLKVTVPKRTGRKRKRGSQDPYTDDGGPVAASEGDNVPAESNLCSQARMDYPTSLMRKLKDNVGKYTIEAVAEVGQTHRYRGIFSTKLVLGSC